MDVVGSIKTDAIIMEDVASVMDVVECVETDATRNCRSVIY